MPLLKVIYPLNSTTNNEKKEKKEEIFTFKLGQINFFEKILRAPLETFSELHPLTLNN